MLGEQRELKKNYSVLPKSVPVILGKLKNRKSGDVKSGEQQLKVLADPELYLSDGATSDQHLAGRFNYEHETELAVLYRQ